MTTGRLPSPQRGQDWWAWAEAFMRSVQYELDRINNLIAGPGGSLLTTYAQVRVLFTRPERLQFKLATETNPITTGVKYTTRIVGARQLLAARGGLTDPTGVPFIMDVKVNGVSMFASPIRIDAGQTTSLTSVVPVVIANPIAPDDAVVTLEVLATGPGARGAWISLITMPS
jgi:hypothetical protein